MASFGVDQTGSAHEQLNEHHDLDHASKGLGIPTYPQTFGWEEVLAIVSCLGNLSVAMIVVYIPRIAVNLGQTKQFIIIGLCLTSMGWSAQLPLR